MKQLFSLFTALTLMCSSGAWATAYRGAVSIDLLYTTYQSGDSIALSSQLVNSDESKYRPQYAVSDPVIDSYFGVDMNYTQPFSDFILDAAHNNYRLLNPNAAVEEYFVVSGITNTWAGGPWIQPLISGRLSGFYTKQELAESLEAINAAATYKLSASVLTTYKNNILNAAIADARGLYDSYVEQIKHLLHVVYNPNASGIGSAKTDDIIISGSIKGSQFTRTGYTFTEWNTQSDGSGTTYNPGDVITVSDNGELVLYAQWTANQYTVTFDMQNGVGGSESATATYDAAMPAINLPTRNNYAFMGYFSEQNGQGTQYYNADGSSAHVWNQPENKTLYANWKAIVLYIDADGTEKYKFDEDVTEITNSSSTLDAGWYVVKGTNVQTNTLVCNGAVHLILADGAKLTATGVYGYGDGEAGIRVSAEGASLTIYGQQNQTGQLIANGSTYCAGIGGVNWGIGHDITINGGMIIASGGYGASAIGSGDDGGVSSNIFVNSSLVLYADGNNPPTTIIRHATSTDASGSLFGKQYAIVRKPVMGIIVTFDKQDGTGGDDQITANENEDMPQINVPTRNGYAFQGYYAEPNGTGVKYYNADGTSANPWNHTESATLYAHWSEPVPYIGTDGETKYTGIDSEIINTTSTLNSGWYIVRGKNITTGTIVCNGEVNLILADGAKLKATGDFRDAGIRVSAEGASLTIYGQENQSGQLIATGGYFGSGIGGADNGSGHDITINGGVIIASGGYGASAIGGGQFGSSSNIFVNSSLVLYADGNNPPATFIRHATDEDVSGLLSGKQYAIVRKPVKGITVTFDKQDGTGGDDQTTANENEEMPQINVPTRNGYAFQGYYAEPNGTGVKYYNADGTSAYLWDHTESATLYAHWKVPVSYIDADGTEKKVGVFEEITNSTTTLAEGWYIVRGADVQTRTLVCEGAVHLILMDGAKLTATGGDLDAGIRVSAEGASLTIYGQKAQNGQLIATGDIFGAGIGGGNYGTGHNITINGGMIIASGGYRASAIGSGDYGGVSSNIHINAALILKADGNATPTTEIEHTSTVDLASALSGKQYATLALPTVTVNHASDMNANFSTFYHTYAAYTVPNEDATIYTAAVETVNNETYLVLHEIEGDVIPAATPVILRTDETTTIDLQPCADASGILIPQNSLSGTNVNLTVAANTVYTLASEDNVLAFYEFGGTEIPAHKAYLQLPAGTPAPRRIGFGSHVTTGVENTEVVSVEKILRNGQLLIRKNGHLYNVQGAVVK